MRQNNQKYNTSFLEWIKSLFLYKGKESISLDLIPNPENEVILSYWKLTAETKKSKDKNLQRMKEHVSIQIPSRLMSCHILLILDSARTKTLEQINSSAYTPTYILADDGMYFVWNKKSVINRNHLITNNKIFVEKIIDGLEMNSHVMSGQWQLSRDEQRLITFITDHNQMVNMTCVYYENPNNNHETLTQFYVDPLYERKIFEGSAVFPQAVRTRYSVKLYSLNIDKMMEFYNMLLNEQLSNFKAYNFSFWTLSSILFTPIKQCFLGPNQIQRELLNNKKPNCSKMAMALLEAGEVHKLNSFYYLTKRSLLTIQPSMLLVCSLAAFLIIYLIKHSLADFFLDLEITSPLVGGGLSLLILFGLFISCGRSVRGTGAVSTPEGIYKFALNTSQKELTIFARNNEIINRQQEGYILMSVGELSPQIP